MNDVPVNFIAGIIFVNLFSNYKKDKTCQVV